jgi:hypothetical protein
MFFGKKNLSLDFSATIIVKIWANQTTQYRLDFFFQTNFGVDDMLQKIIIKGPITRVLTRWVRPINTQLLLLYFLILFKINDYFFMVFFSIFLIYI